MYWKRNDWYRMVFSVHLFLWVVCLPLLQCPRTIYISGCRSDCSASPLLPFPTILKCSCHLFIISLFSLHQKQMAWVTLSSTEDHSSNIWNTSVWLVPLRYFPYMTWSSYTYHSMNDSIHHCCTGSMVVWGRHLFYSKSKPWFNIPPAPLCRFKPICQPLSLHPHAEAISTWPGCKSWAADIRLSRPAAALTPLISCYP